MAGRFRGDEQYPPRPGNYHTNSSHSIDGRYQRIHDRNHERAQSEHPPRNEQGRVPRALNSAYTRRRHNSLNAFVEDERDALAREHNPASAGLLSAGDDEPIQRGDVDQIPILMEVVNPERRFVIIPKAPTVEPEAKAAEGSGRGHGSVASSVSSVSRNSKTSQDSTGSPSTITATASTITSTESTITPTGSPSTPTGPSSSSYGGIRTPPASSRQPDKVSEYEANTCRKFTVPRIDSEPYGSGGSGGSGSGGGSGHHGDIIKSKA
ncbi:hypothetical protein SPBR_07594 [Sporothrix brasiliensis 5110]|uniref:Uncharacterized protein n=1 Tax=Sporothrix brasiliensis 5110 TaxID=1398154 RepID=A0A0C2IGQ2_9PEZI|nr:uncharacterized protein SPBR_07594 [Sporothrix brasiliensis 5110]KIH88386.1 hypothetical protein SPBR_07594 [Sporothrix brasiliensis 5110]